MSRISRLVALGVAAAAFATLAVACGGDDPTATPTSAPAATATAIPTATPTLAPGETPRPTPTPPPPPPAEPTATPVPSFNADEYFSGKTIRIITGTSPGGGYDVFSRLVGQTAAKYFPKGTRFVVINRPGGAQLRGLRDVLSAEPDGYTTGPVHSRWFQRQALIGDIDGFNLNAIHILGSATFQRNPNAFCVDRSVATSWEEVLALGRPLISGQTGPGNEPGPEYIQFKTKGIYGNPDEGIIKMVAGYGGTSEIMAAFDRGEIDATDRCGPSTAGRLYPEWLEQKRMIPLFYEITPYSEEWMAELGYDGPYPYPFVLDIELPGFEVTDADRQAFNAFVNVDQLSRVFILPEGVQQEVIDFWQSAFDKIVVDTAFVEAVNIAGYGDAYGIGTGADMRAIVTEIQALAPETLDLVIELSQVDTLNP